MRLYSPFIFIPILLSPVACTEADHDAEPRQIEVHFRIAEGAGTKATVLDESAVKCTDILVFRSSDGDLVCSERTFSLESTVSVPAGVSVDCYALTNLPEGILEGIDSRQALFSTVLSLPECVSGERGFVMNALVVDDSAWELNSQYFIPSGWTVETASE